MSRRLRILGLIMAGILAAVSSSGQTTYTWTGQAGDGLFNNPGNWQGNVVPTGSSSDNIIFGVYPLQNVRITTSINVGDITFSGIQDGFYLNYQFPDTPTITINGNVSTTAGSTYWGLFNTPVLLSAGNHNFNPGGSADLYFFADISGPGGITLNGPNNLILTYSSTYSGGTTINGGILFVGADSALGTGTVTLNGGRLATSYTFSQVLLPNNFILPSNVTFGSYVPDNQPMTLGVASTTTLAPSTGVPTVNLSLIGNQPLYIDGDMVNGSGVTRYTFTNEAASFGYYLSGHNSYTGGTEVSPGSSVFFSYGFSVPTTGFIYAPADAYAGLGDSSMNPGTFISRFDLANSAGIVGFDNGYSSAGAVDLSGFSNPSLAIGTQSSATLNGPITPVPGSGQYNFRGAGWLLLADPSSINPLTGNNDLHVTSMGESSPMVVVLNAAGTNNYTGSTIADAAAIVFDSDSSLSGGTSIQLHNGGYVGVTNNSGLSLTDLIGSFVSVSNGGVLGLDSSVAVNNNGSGPLYTYSGAVDFKSLGVNLYLGTTGQTAVNGTIETTNNNTGDYFLTGYKGGVLTIGTQLTGSKAVNIGIPDLFQDGNTRIGYSTVKLTNPANNFTGGIVLNSGTLAVTDPAALGPGTVTLLATATDNSAAFEGPYLGTVTNNFNLTSGTLMLNSSTNLSGVISGPGQLRINSNLALSAANSYSGGTLVDYSTLSSYANGALGTGGVDLINGGTVQFYTTAPQIGSLLRGDAYTEDGLYHASLILAATGTTALTINQAVDGYFSGSIVESGSVGSLIKTGPASLQIGGDLNSGFVRYSGGTTILQGKLIAGSSGALGTGTITINGGLLDTTSGVALTNLIAFGANGGTLGGNGTFNTPVTAGTNVILSPGNSPGTLTFGSGLTLAPGGTMNFEVQAANGAPGTGYDLVKVSGGLLNITATAGSPFTLKLISLNASGTPGNVSDFNSALGYSWMLITGNSAGGLTGFNANNFLIDASAFSNNLNGGTFSLTTGLDGINPAIFLNFSPVPEPSTYVLLLLGLAGFALNARRRRA